MKNYSSTINGITFSASAEEPLYPQVQILFHVIGEIPPEDIKNRYTVQIGFSVFFLVQKGNDYCIAAPDYTKSPFSDTTEDLTIALYIQLEQGHLVKLYNLQPEDIRFDDEIVIAKNALQEKDIMLQRFSDLGGSGWCISSIENRDIDEYETLYAYQLLTIRPELIKVLALPYEYIVVFLGDTIDAILNEKDENIMTE